MKSSLPKHNLWTWHWYYEPICLEWLYIYIYIYKHSSSPGKNKSKKAQEKSVHIMLAQKSSIYSYYTNHDGSPITLVQWPGLGAFWILHSVGIDCILAKAKVISGWASTCDSAYSWWLYSAAPLGNQGNTTSPPHHLTTSQASHPHLLGTMVCDISV